MTAITEKIRDSDERKILPLLSIFVTPLTNRKFSKDKVNSVG
mgnify:CR=1 FL=1